MSDTNESLAMLAKDGDREALHQLWAQNERLLTKLFSRYFPLCRKYRCEPDDLLQCGYFVIQKAAGAFEPARGLKFTTYLHYHVQTEAHEVFCLRGKVRPPEVSGSTPVGSEDGETELLDLIPDEDAAEAFERTVDDVYTRQLHEALEAGLERLPPRHAEAIRAKHWDGQTLEQVGVRLGVGADRVRQMQSQGYRRLKGHRQLQAWREDIINSAMRQVGLGRFKHTRQSAVEWAVERLEDRGAITAGAEI